MSHVGIHPESFVRGLGGGWGGVGEGGSGWSNFDNFFFSLMRGWRIQIPLLAGHQLHTSESLLNSFTLVGR